MINMFVQNVKFIFAGTGQIPPIFLLSLPLPFPPRRHPWPGTDLSTYRILYLCLSHGTHHFLFYNIDLFLSIVTLWEVMSVSNLYLILPHEAVWWMKKMKQVFQKFPHSMISLFGEYLCRDYPTLITSHLNFSCHEKPTKAWFPGLNALDFEAKVYKGRYLVCLFQNLFILMSIMPSTKQTFHRLLSTCKKTISLFVVRISVILNQ